MPIIASLSDHRRVLEWTLTLLNAGITGWSSSLFCQLMRA